MYCTEDWRTALILKHSHCSTTLMDSHSPVPMSRSVSCHITTWHIYLPYSLVCFIQYHCSLGAIHSPTAFGMFSFLVREIHLSSVMLWPLTILWVSITLPGYTTLYDCVLCAVSWERSIASLSKAPSTEQLHWCLWGSPEKVEDRLGASSVDSAPSSPG